MVMLMGLKSINSTVGTKPATKAQLDSAMFKKWNGSPDLAICPIYRWAMCFMVKALPSIRTVFFYIFSWVGLI
jgi:hypothetical protein